MTTYLVEAYVAKLDEVRRRDLAAAARAAAEAMTREGVPVRYLGSIFVPEDETCFHLLEAPSTEVLRQASGRGAFAFERIVEVIESRGAPTNGKEPDMAQYMVERHLPGFPPDELPAAAAAAKRTAQEMSATGVDIRYVRSTWTPADECCYCLFEGPSAEAVEDLQKRAQLPYTAVREAAFLVAEELELTVDRVATV
jgi:hypothetical protein